MVKRKTKSDRSAWSKGEEKVLVSCIVPGLSIKVASANAANKLARSAKACELHWYVMNKKPKKSEDMLVKSVQNSDEPRELVLNPVSNKMQITVIVQESTITIQKTLNGVETLIVV